MKPSINKSIVFLLLLSILPCYGQSTSGRIFDAQTLLPIEFVEVGILNKNIGTISDIDGRYNIDLNSANNTDTLRFSHPSFEPIEILLSTYKENPDKDIRLNPKEDNIETIIVDHRKFKQQVLGNVYQNKKYQGGFIGNIKGFECGVLLSIPKRAILQKLIINIADCAYDEIYFRVNIYKQIGKNKFENILSDPIYIKQSIVTNEKELNINLSSHYVHVDGNTLVTLQQIAYLGQGQLLFPGSAFKGSASYYRTSSQGRWAKTPMKLSFRVESLVEK